MTENKDKLLEHSLIMKDRKEISLTGVTDVDSFDENSIVAYTNYGELTISGSSLHISALDTEKGELCIDGEISALSYLDNRPKSEGFFKRVFR